MSATGAQWRYVAPVEMRVVRDADKPPKIQGYAAVFETDSVDMGGFVEQIAQGAFSKALETGPDVRALINHDPNLLLGRTTSGTLRLKQDEKGLWMESDLPDTQAARDLAVSMERGDVDQMSFAFSLKDGSETWDDSTKPPTVTINSIAHLYDVSVVTYPAYPDTSVALRSLEQARERTAKETEAAQDADAIEVAPEPEDATKAAKRRLEESRQREKSRIKTQLAEKLWGEKGQG